MRSSRSGFGMSCGWRHTWPEAPRLAAMAKACRLGQRRAPGRAVCRRNCAADARRNQRSVHVERVAPQRVAAAPACGSGCDPAASTKAAAQRSAARRSALAGGLPRTGSDPNTRCARHSKVGRAGSADSRDACSHSESDEAARRLERDAQVQRAGPVRHFARCTRPGAAAPPTAPATRRPRWRHAWPRSAAGDRRRWQR